MGWGDSIPIVEGEIGPPRSGFVHRLCIRKADEAWGEAARDDGLADTRFCNPRSRGLGRNVQTKVRERARSALPRVAGAPQAARGGPSFPYGASRSRWRLFQGRRHKQTTPEVQPCRSSAPLPIIGVPALLKLADWSRLRREQSQHGGSSCDTTPPVQSPPRPLKPSRRVSSDAPLASPPPIRPRADAPDAQPRRRAATPKASRRQGGRS